MTGPNAYFDPTDKPFAFDKVNKENLIVETPMQPMEIVGCNGEAYKPGPTPMYKFTIARRENHPPEELRQDIPNWWWRMWQYLLLGFKWEKIK